MFKKLQTKLAGYKTYAVGLITAILGVINAVHLHKFDFQNISAFIAAGGITALRASVSKVESALKAKK
jgi:hypothetical protein